MKEEEQTGNHIQHQSSTKKLKILHGKYIIPLLIQHQKILRKLDNKCKKMNNKKNG